MEKGEASRVPKILLLDIETAPALVYSWGLFQQDHGINQIKVDGYMLCWCAKWLGSREILSDSLVEHSLFKKDKTNDSIISRSIHKLIDLADIVITHNGRSFDIKWVNTCFVKNKLSPIQGYKTVDTYVEAKRNFYFISNKLDFLCNKLDLGRKIDTGGFELWEECMRGEVSSWKKMVSYCKHDVRLLERLYLKLRPFMSSHPNMNHFMRGIDNACPVCGCKSLRFKGYRYLAKGRKRRFLCKRCKKGFTSGELLIK